MNSRQLQYVLAVAEERSFTKASKRLIIAQPSLSQFISKLEQDIGHELFDRTYSPMRLTPAGEVYIETARRILDMETEMNKRMNDMKGVEYGRLVIGASPHRSSCLLPEKLKVLTDKYPYYEIVIREYYNKQLLKYLDDGELDMCITMLPVNENKYNYVNILDEEILMAAPEAHPINGKVLPSPPFHGRRHPVVDLREFQDMPFIIVSEANRMHEITYDLCQQAGYRPRIAVECGSFEACRALAVAGVGVTLLSSTTLEHADNMNGLKCYSLQQKFDDRNVVAIFRKNHYISHVALDFLEILKGREP